MLDAGAAATLAKVLTETSHRVRLRRGVLAITPGALIGGAVALAAIALAKSSLLPLFAAYIAPVAVLLGAGLSFLIAWSRAISNEEMAQILDRRFGYAERILTGWEIAQRGAATPMETAAIERAAVLAAQAQIKDAVPVHAPKGSGFSLASFVLPIVLAFVIPTWMPNFVRQAQVEKEQLKQAGKELAKKAEAMSSPAATATPTPPANGKTDKPENPKNDGKTAKGETPKKDGDKSGEKKNEPVEKLKQLAQKMQDGSISKREAMKQLSELDKEIAKQQSEGAKSEAGRQLARAASEMEKDEATKDLGKAIAEGDAEKIRKEERELEKKFDQKGDGGFEKKQQQSLAEKLDKIADALEQGGDQQAASEARKAAESLRKGDKDGAKEHLNKADLAGAVQQQHEGDPVHKMAQELQKNSDTKQAGSNLDKGAGKQTADELSRLADRVEKGELGKDGEEQLQKTLEQASKEGQSQGKNTPGEKLSKPMASAAKSLSKGNKAGAAEALRDMSQSMKTGTETAKSNADARQALAEAKQQLNGGQGGKVTKMKWGEGEGQGQGQGRPVAKGPADGSQKAGTEAGYGTSKYQDSGYDATKEGPQHDRQADKSGDWRKEYEQAYKAARTDKASLSDTRVKGQMTAGERQSIEIEGDPNRDKGKAQAQYVEVPNGYREAAEEAVGNEDIPPEHRERVKAYFEALSGNQDKPQAAGKDAGSK